MNMKTGQADLPLHYGKAPSWLFERMKKLTRQVLLALANEYPVEEILRRLADPFWFQALGCLLGFDWHSSGLTTTTCGALKESLKDVGDEIGLFMAGGKGKTSRQTPQEINLKLEKLGQVDVADKLVYASRLSAKVDSSAVQDGFQIYHHTFIFTPQGSWAVIQQGMNEELRAARRYHWLSDNLNSFVCEPHCGIVSETKTNTLNLVAKEVDETREAITYLSRQKPEKTLKALEKYREMKLPPRHHLLLSDINPARLKKTLLLTYEREANNFETLLAQPGVGAKTLRALSLLAELLYGTPLSWRDPARYSFAHGGKDGYPYPVDQETYDHTIETLRQAVSQARLDKIEKTKALKRLANIGN
jgi:hypothetical protein